MQTWPLRQRGVIPAIFLALMTTLAILLPPCTVALSAATSTASFVQAAASAAHGTPTTLSLAFPSSTRAGDLLLVAFDYDSSVTPASVTDSQGDVFTAVGNQLNSPGGALSRVYYAKNITGGADTVTVTLSAESSYLELYLSEYSGINTTNPIDAEVGASGNAGTVSSGSVTTTAAGDIVYGYCVGDGVCSLGSGFTARSTLDANLMEDKTAGSAGSYAATGSATNGWTMQMVALKPASVVTPPVITSATTTSGTAAKALSYQITATGTPSSYGATGLPAGLSVNCGTGLISGTPTSSGTSTVALSATNAGGTGKATLTVTIAAAVPAAFVQAAASAAHGTPTTLSLAFPSSTRAGDLLLVAFDYDSSVTPASVTDSQGAVFTAVGNQLSTPGGALSRVYYAKNIKGGADTVTVTLSASSSYLELYLSEYSGINTTNPIDTEVGASGNAGTVSSGSVATTATGDIIYGYCVADWSCNVGSGFNARSTLDGNLMEDETAGGAGNYAATGTSDGGWTMQMVALSPASASAGGPAPGASLSPASLTFASQTVGASGSAQTVTLTNTGNATLTLTGISITGADPSDFTETNNCGSSIAAGAGCTISITFTPGASGSLSATLSVTATSVGDPSVGLTGTGTSTGGGTGGSAPLLTLSSASLAFGSQPVDATSSAQTVTLSNTGSAALSITSLTITGTNAGNFAEIGNTCGSSVAAGGTCTVAVTFTPSAAGSSTAALSITDNATGSPQSISLSGTGAHDVILSWTASTTPGVLGYDVYRGTTSGGESSTPLNSSPINGITFTDSNVTAGQAYYYVITTVNSNDAQSGSSSETSVTVP
jgi:hypothetical protein